MMWAQPRRETSDREAMTETNAEQPLTVLRICHTIYGVLVSLQGLKQGAIRCVINLAKKRPNYRLPTWHPRVRLPAGRCCYFYFHNKTCQYSQFVPSKNYTEKPD